MATVTDPLDDAIREHLGSVRRAAHWISGFYKGAHWHREHVSPRMLELAAKLGDLDALEQEHEERCGCEGEACWFGSLLAERRARP